MKKPSLKINALSNWTSLGVNILIGFLLTPFIIRNLGKTGYGIWTLVGSFVGYYGLLNLGVGSAITRYIARYTAQKEGQKLNEVASTALAMFTVTGIVAVAVSFLLAGTIADFFKIASEDRDGFIKLVRIIGMTCGINFPGSIFGAIVTAREHFVANNIVTIIRALLRAGLIILFINMGWGLVGVGLAPLAATAVAIFSSIFLFRRYASDVVLRLGHANKQMLKTLLVYGGITTVVMVADILRIQFDSFVIGKFVSMEAVGVYGVAALLIRYMTRVVSAGMGVLSPRFAALDGVDGKGKLHELFLRSLKISSFLGFGICTAMIIFGPRFIIIWVGSGYEGAISVLLILCCSYAFALSQNPGISLLFALNKHKYYAVFTIIEGLVNIALSVLLVGPFGIAGVAMGTMISMLIIKIFIMPIYICKVIDLRLFAYFKVFLYPLVVSSLMILIVYLLEFNDEIFNANLTKYILLCFGFAVLFPLLLMPVIKNELYKTNKRSL